MKLPACTEARRPKPFIPPLRLATFVTGDEQLDAEFVTTAKQAGLDGLKGHRSVGGMRASLYNAFPSEGVGALIGVMRRFEAGRES